jgi:hypothetical protein
MRSVTLTLNEEEVHRLYVALHSRIDLLRRLSGDPDGCDLRVIDKYTPLLERINAAYLEFFTEENHVGSTDTEEDHCDV